MKLPLNDLREFLDEKVARYNTRSFLDSDPIQLPHRFTRKEDIEIVGFLVATIAWGNRKSIIASGEKLIQIMGNDPFEFVTDYVPGKLADKQFVHRTFNSVDLDFFLRSLQAIYRNGGLEYAFSNTSDLPGAKGRIISFRERFLAVAHDSRSEKHLSNPLKGASAKRLNMFLRWMVRPSTTGVDFGLWKSINTSELMLPLDVHTGNIARKLEILQRTQNDWRALEEIHQTLNILDPNDPVKYDFALFGLGAFEQF